MRRARRPAFLTEDRDPAISSARDESDPEIPSTRDATRCTSLSTFLDHRTRSAEETTASSAGDAERDPQPAMDAPASARRGPASDRPPASWAEATDVSASPSIYKHGSQLSRAGGNRQQQQHPPAEQKSTSQSVPHLEPVSLTLLHRALRSRVDDYRTGPRSYV